MECIGFVIKLGDKRAQTLGIELAKWIESKGIKVLAEDSCADVCNLPPVKPTQLSQKCDLVVVLGGDGTLIHAASLMHKSVVPIIGINVGTLGFLTEITVDEAKQVLTDAIQGKLRTSKRNRLEVLLVDERGNERNKWTVLNDVVVLRGALSKMLELQVSVDGNHATTYRSDGLIVATPTGSTAYNLAAGGPIVHPELDCMLLTPICPHKLTDRIVVLPSSSTIEVKLTSNNTEAFISADGKMGVRFNKGDTVRVEKSNYPIEIVLSPSMDYYAILRRKLKWGEGE